MFTTALCAFFVAAVFAKDSEIVLQVKPETIIKTLDALKTSGYFQKIADELAVKTAEQFIKQLRKDRMSHTTQPELDASSKLSLQRLEDFSEKLRQGSSPGPVETHPNLDRKVNHESVQWKMHSGSKEHIDHDVSYEERRSQQLLALMETPPPDGDNLDDESVLTELEEPKTNNPINSYKINGKHFRRYDFFWK